MRDRGRNNSRDSERKGKREVEDREWVGVRKRESNGHTVAAE